MTTRTLLAALVALAATPALAKDAPSDFTTHWDRYAAAMSKELVPDTADVSLAYRNQYAVMTTERAGAEIAKAEGAKQHATMAKQSPSSVGTERGCGCALDRAHQG